MLEDQGESSADENLVPSVFLSIRLNVIIQSEWNWLSMKFQSYSNCSYPLPTHYRQTVFINSPKKVQLTSLCYLFVLKNVPLIKLIHFQKQNSWTNAAGELDSIHVRFISNTSSNENNRAGQLLGHMLRLTSFLWIMRRIRHSFTVREMPQKMRQVWREHDRLTIRSCNKLVKLLSLNTEETN